MTISLSSLKEELRSDVYQAVHMEIAELCREIMTKTLNRTVYSRMIGSSYDYTFQLLDAVYISPIKVSGDAVQFTVEIKGDMLTKNVTADGEWNQHTGFGDYDISGDGLIEVLDQGSGSGSLFNHKGHQFYDEGESEINQRMVRELASALRSRGWDVRG